MDRIQIEYGQQTFNGGKVRKHKDYYIAYFNNRPLWILLRNTYYKETMEAEFPNEHYQSKNNVPIYNIMKKGKKVGNFFPRKSEETGNDFLFCPKNKNIKKDYYIWYLENKHTIPDKANVLRFL